MRISLLGACVGAVSCAVGRGLVVFYSIPNAPLVFSLPSAAIGLVVGAVAGAASHPVRSTIIGASLSGVIFVLFLLPVASLLGGWGQLTGAPNSSGDFLRSTIKYAFQMAMAGGIAGFIGGSVGKHCLQDRTRDQG